MDFKLNIEVSLSKETLAVVAALLGAASLPKQEITPVESPLLPIKEKTSKKKVTCESEEPAAVSELAEKAVAPIAAPETEKSSETVEGSAPDETEEQPEVSLQDLRTLIRANSGSEAKRTEMSAILKKYGATGIAHLSMEHYNAVYAEFLKL